MTTTRFGAPGFATATDGQHVRNVTTTSTETRPRRRGIALSPTFLSALMTPSKIGTGRPCRVVESGKLDPVERKSAAVGRPIVQRCCGSVRRFVRNHIRHLSVFHT